MFLFQKDQSYVVTMDKLFMKRQLYCHHPGRSLRVRFARILFYGLLAGVVFMIVYYKSVLASVSIQITFASGSGSDNGEDKVSTLYIHSGGVGLRPPSQRFTDANKSDLSQPERSIGTEEVDVASSLKEFDFTNGHTNTPSTQNLDSTAALDHGIEATTDFDYVSEVTNDHNPSILESEHTDQPFQRPSNTKRVYYGLKSTTDVDQIQQSEGSADKKDVDLISQEFINSENRAENKNDAEHVSESIPNFDHLSDYTDDFDHKLDSIKEEVLTDIDILDHVFISTNTNDERSEVTKQIDHDKIDYDNNSENANKPENVNNSDRKTEDAKELDHKSHVYNEFDPLSNARIAANQPHGGTEYFKRTSTGLSSSDDKAKYPQELKHISDDNKTFDHMNDVTNNLDNKPEETDHFDLISDGTNLYKRKPDVQNDLNHISENATDLNNFHKSTSDFKGKSSDVNYAFDHMHVSEDKQDVDGVSMNLSHISDNTSDLIPTPIIQQSIDHSDLDLSPSSQVSQSNLTLNAHPIAKISDNTNDSDLSKPYKSTQYTNRVQLSNLKHSKDTNDLYRSIPALPMEDTHNRGPLPLVKRSDYTDNSDISKSVQQIQDTNYRNQSPPIKPSDHIEPLEFQKPSLPIKDTSDLDPVLPIRRSEHINILDIFQPSRQIRDTSKDTANMESLPLLRQSDKTNSLDIPRLSQSIKVTNNMDSLPQIQHSETMGNMELSQLSQTLKDPNYVGPAPPYHHSEPTANTEPSRLSQPIKDTYYMEPSPSIQNYGHTDNMDLSRLPQPIKDTHYSGQLPLIRHTENADKMDLSRLPQQIKDTNYPGLMTTNQQSEHIDSVDIIRLPQPIKDTQYLGQLPSIQHSENMDLSRLPQPIEDINYLGHLPSIQYSELTDNVDVSRLSEPIKYINNQASFPLIQNSERLNYIVPKSLEIQDTNDVLKQSQFHQLVDSDNLDVLPPPQRSEGTFDFIQPQAKQATYTDDRAIQSLSEEHIGTAGLIFRSPTQRFPEPNNLEISRTSRDLVHTDDVVSKVTERLTQQQSVISKPHWQAITQNGNLVIYGAYFNRHTTLGLVVQIIIVRKERDPGQVNGGWPSELVFSCDLLYTSDQPGVYRTVTVTSTPFYLWSGHHNTRYRPGHICCRLPDDQLPEAVSVPADSQAPLNQVRINYEQLQHNPRTFTLCLSPLHFTKNADHSLVQYFELNKLLGAEYFYVYNLQVTEKMQKVIDFYSKKINIEVIPWKLPTYLRGEDNMWYFAQTIALNDCFLRSRGNTEYLITTDLDEFIFPKAPSLTWKDMLEKEKDSCSFNFHCVVIDMTKKLSVIKNNKRKSTALKYGLFTLLYQTKYPYLISGKVKSKQIVKSDCYDGINVHTPMNTSNIGGEEAEYNVNSTIGVMYHYASPNANFLGDGKPKTGRIEKKAMSYATELLKNVGQKLNRLAHV